MCDSLSLHKKSYAFWLANLMNNPHTVATLDVSTDEKQKVIDQINRALDELNDRSDNERKATDRNKSAGRIPGISGICPKIDF